MSFLASICCCFAGSSTSAGGSNSKPDQRSATASSSGAGGSSGAAKPGGARDEIARTLVRFSEYKHSGIRASNFSVAGEGMCLVNTPLFQTKAYWELKVSELGASGNVVFGFGVAARDGKADLDKSVTERKNSFGMNSAKLKLKAGDIIGVSYDLSEVRPVLSFTLNGIELPDATVRDMRCASDLYPAVSITGTGGMLEANFGQSSAFTHPNGFPALMLSRDMI